MRKEPVSGGRRTAADYRRLVREHRRSGLTVRAFAAANGVKFGTFSWWQGELRRRARQASPRSKELIPVEVINAPALPAPAHGFEVRLARGDVVFVPPGFDDATLARLLAALRR